MAELDIQAQLAEAKKRKWDDRTLAQRSADMAQELLLASDVLLTDYSSCMWDFSLMKKPCFLYARDIDEYRGERDFYTPIESWPFPLAADNDGLEKVIAEFDEEAYRADAARHHAELGSTESGTAAKQCAERIVEFLSK